MKKYIGTKQLQAKRMTRGEYNKYRGWTIPKNENPNEEGYLVKYQDGYESWSPKKQFEEAYVEYNNYSSLPETAILMNSKDYKERFKAEFYQLQIRYNGLKNMLDKWDRGELQFKPTCPRSTYNVQLKAMSDYMEVLDSRAVLENIEL